MENGMHMRMRVRVRVLRVLRVRVRVHMRVRVRVRVSVRVRVQISNYLPLLCTINLPYLGVCRLTIRSLKWTADRTPANGQTWKPFMAIFSKAQRHAAIHSSSQLHPLAPINLKNKFYIVPQMKMHERNANQRKLM